MKIAIQLALRNLFGAGLRTWLNVGVLSFAFIIIIFYRGWIDGWNEQAKRDSITWQYGAGYVQHPDFDPLDPFTYADAHATIPERSENLAPVLVRQGSIYPEGRMVSVLLKGIDPDQTSVALPTDLLKDSSALIPAIVGKSMARKMGISEGDEMLVRWRDANGTFDATTIRIVGVFASDVPAVDLGQIYLSISDLWRMTGLENQASFLIANENYIHREESNWVFLSREELLREFDEIIRSKQWGGLVMQGLLLGIALLAIFDTQVLSVFRRQKEIGTYISLGMTRKQVVGIFTVEGGMNSVLAALLGGVYGIPLLAYVARTGIAMPGNYEDSGLPISDRIYPVFGLMLILSTVLLVVVSATIVSYMPSRKIARMDPVQALKGKVQ